MKKNNIYLIIILLCSVFITGCNKKSNNDMASLIPVNFIVDYGTQSGLNYNDDAKVLVDGEQIDIVKYGSYGRILEAFLSEGKHTISLESNTLIRKNKSNKVSIEVGDQTEFYLSISQSSLTGLQLALVENESLYDSEYGEFEEYNIEGDNSYFEADDYENKDDFDDYSKNDGESLDDNYKDELDDSIELQEKVCEKGIEDFEGYWEFPNQAGQIYIEKYGNTYVLEDFHNDMYSHTTWEYIGEYDSEHRILVLNSCKIEESIYNESTEKYDTNKYTEDITGYIYNSGDGKLNWVENKKEYDSDDIPSYVMSRIRY